MKFNVNEIQLSKNDIARGLTLPTVISEKLAYLCGIFTGDGSIYERTDKKDYVLKCVGNPKDEQELYYEVIGPYFKEVFGIIPDIKLHDSGTTFGFVVFSKSLLTFLTQKVGLHKGKKNKKLGIPAIFKGDKLLLIPFIRGLFDTDGCMCFKKRYRKIPYYPVISLSSLSEKLIREVAQELKKLGFKVVEIYQYKVVEPRAKKGFTIINRIELNGFENLDRWLSTVGFSSPKHLNKIKKHYEKI